MPKRRVANVMAAALGAIGAVTSGCVTMPADRSYGGPVPKPDELVQEFSYERQANAYHMRTVDEKSHYTIKRVTFDSQVNVLEPHRIKIDYYDLPNEDPVPVIVVLPILGGGNTFAKIFADHFARRGYAAVIVHRQQQYKRVDELAKLNGTFKQIVLDHMQALDWIELQSDLDQNRIGIFGISAGGIKATLIHCLEDRINAAVTALAGGDIPYIFSYSAEKGIAKKRKKILDEHSVTQDELYKILSDEFQHDPLKYAKYGDARNTLLILGAFDQAVPYKKGLELRAALGDPKTIVMPAGHYTSLLFIPFVQEMATSFFKKTFVASATRTAEASRVLSRRRGFGTAVTK